MHITYIDNLVEWEKLFQFYCPVKVRFSETDAFGHVNNTKVFAYFEEARIDFFKEIGLFSTTLKDQGSIIVTADLQCNYVKQLFFDERLKVYVGIKHVGTTSIDLHYMVKNERDEICLTGRGLIVQISKETGKSIPWTDAMKSKLQTSILQR
ncbi:acyl-CoA thioesterase [Bacillus alkalicellulosilyticus]|uniref:acyl-CoA thioesterase n=1 Tax=Alkalihalobacterium alkalicellulosilyticum TaxID=1912214 RepID=UPI000998158A|nr:thioesterase family protein [Bacillus alkalicellulosilyticus]